MSTGPDVRASDDERERAAAEIREHYAAGRLSEDELNERVGAVYEARTAGDLQALRFDLPSLPASAAQTRAELARRRSHLQRELIQQTGGGLAPFAVCTVIWVASGAHGSFWPAWIALVALIPLLRNGWLLYGPAPELDRVEQEIARRRDRREDGGHRHEHRQRRQDRRDHRRDR